MSPVELETYLHRHIPLSAAMQVAVESVSVEGVVLRAPLAPNINHRETVFGGSASAVAILAAWALLHIRLNAAGVSARVVIQRNRMEYLHPITGSFTATGEIAPAEWERFERALARKGRARIAAAARLTCEGRIVGRLEGEFVALAHKA